MRTGRVKSKRFWLWADKGQSTTSTDEIAAAVYPGLFSAGVSGAYGGPTRNTAYKENVVSRAKGSRWL